MLKIRVLILQKKLSNIILVKFMKRRMWGITMKGFKISIQTLANKIMAILIIFCMIFANFALVGSRTKLTYRISC